MLDIYNNVNVTVTTYESKEEAYKHYQTLVSKGIACAFYPGYEDWQVTSYEPISKAKEDHNTNGKIYAVNLYYDNGISASADNYSYDEIIALYTTKAKAIEHIKAIKVKENWVEVNDCMPPYAIRAMHKPFSSSEEAALATEFGDVPEYVIYSIREMEISE